MTQSKNKPHSRPAPPKTPFIASFLQAQGSGDLLVTDELERALEECKLRVAEIATDCRRKNRKFRDIEFNLEDDKYRCLQGLEGSSYEPSDVQRVTQIFDKPTFSIGGADSNDIIQGALGDCWFLSALATMSTYKGLVEKFCVARDEQVGVYGFIFFRDAAWVTIIIDDLLFTSIPKFEELSDNEKQLYHHDKDVYNKSARKNGKSLYFAKSGTHGETWVPLIEKAYAKLHGNYASLDGGMAGEAIEDLTGGVTSFIYTKDILDPDAFWTNELLQANTDRLFSCAFDNLSSTRSGVSDVRVNGLIGGHAYSVLRTVEYNGKRFVVIRNPWGCCEWTGPWSDGSKEWTPEWLPALQVLEHKFGDDGEFVMEYKDFLENWERVDRTLLFDSSWIMSSQWVKVTTRPLPSPWAYGDVSFTIYLPSATSAIIVLSQLDDRYWKTICCRARWSFDFIVYKKGESKPITTSSASLPWSRSVNAEVFLEAGEYVVHVRLDRTFFRPKVNIAEDLEPPQERIYARLLTEKVKSQSIVSNFDATQKATCLPVPLDFLAGRDLLELEAEAAWLSLSENTRPSGQETEASAFWGVNDPSMDVTSAPTENGVEEGGDDSDKNIDYGKGGADEGGGESGRSKAEENTTEGTHLDDIDADEDNTVYLGLRVYTNKEAPAKVNGQLRRTLEPLASLASKLCDNNQWA